MRISDWSSDVCSSDLKMMGVEVEVLPGDWRRAVDPAALEARLKQDKAGKIKAVLVVQVDTASSVVNDIAAIRKAIDAAGHGRSEEHTSELQSLMRNSYAVLCLKKKTRQRTIIPHANTPKKYQNDQS